MKMSKSSKMGAPKKGPLRDGPRKGAKKGSRETMKNTKPIPKV